MSVKPRGTQMRPQVFVRSSQLNNRRRRLATNHLLVSVKCMEKLDTASRIALIEQTC